VITVVRRSLRQRTAKMSPTQQRYRNHHRIFTRRLIYNAFCRFGSSQSGGMISGGFLGGRTPVPASGSARNLIDWSKALEKLPKGQQPVFQSTRWRVPIWGWLRVFSCSSQCSKTADSKTSRMVTGFCGSQRVKTPDQNRRRSEPFLIGDSILASDGAHFPMYRRTA